MTARGLIRQSGSRYDKPGNLRLFSSQDYGQQYQCHN